MDTRDKYCRELVNRTIRYGVMKYSGSSNWRIGGEHNLNLKGAMLTQVGP